ncbi:MAG: 2-succinyl-5-enolpyruvyl-6-hydroxy-3-cyclohexene-1-carboxylic-acid synthase [Candidatus Nanopelagicales bacterium]
MNEATELALTLLGELIHQGVRELVLAPGSRSAPLAFAAAAAERAGALRLHLRIDERDAGFVGLGLAKAGGAPVVVACTSGTAVANLMPAVVEASYSGIPLVVVTADRPPESRGVGAPQTIDQVGFFGEHVRFSADLSTERNAPLGSTLTAVRGTAGAAISAALGSPGRELGHSDLAHVGPAHSGPVHINVGFRLPLVPDGPTPEWPSLDASGPARRRRPPLTGCGSRTLDGLIGAVPDRGMLVVGDLPATPLRGYQQWLGELAGACGWPVIAEPSANLTGAATALRYGVLALGSDAFVARHRPDLVLTAGQFGLSRPTLSLLRTARRHIAIELPTVGREACDPARTATDVLSAIPLPPAGYSPAEDWLATWAQADRRIGRALGALPADHFTGVTAATTVSAAVAEGSLLLLGPSWPVRHVEAFGQPASGVRVIGNRGANGIDGLISTAWGAALAHQAGGGGAAFALLGDLAFLHDHNGLLVGAGESVPDLTIVVVDNNGGGIFHQLEQGRQEFGSDFERLFGTPHNRDLAAIATAAGWPARTVTTAAELAEELRSAIRGVRVLVARVMPRQSELADLRARTRAARDALAE